MSKLIVCSDLALFVLSLLYLFLAFCFLPFVLRPAYPSFFCFTNDTPIDHKYVALDIKLKA